MFTLNADQLRVRVLEQVQTVCTVLLSVEKYSHHFAVQNKTKKDFLYKDHAHVIQFYLFLGNVKRRAIWKTEMFICGALFSNVFVLSMCGSSFEDSFVPLTI